MKSQMPLHVQYAMLNRILDEYTFATAPVTQTLPGVRINAILTEAENATRATLERECEAYLAAGGKIEDAEIQHRPGEPARLVRKA